MDDSFWIFYYFLAPLVIFVSFTVAMYLSDQKNILREGALLISFIPAMVLISLVGFIAWAVNNEPVTILTAALAQSVPLSFATFRYSEAKSEAEKSALKYHLDRMIEDHARLCGRVGELENAR